MKKQRASWLSKGDKVRWQRKRTQRHKPNSGTGVITRVCLPLGNCPLTYEVDTYADGVLFSDEVRRA
jgi:hypothetical protein